MKYLISVLNALMNSLTLFPYGLEKVNYCSFASCFEDFDFMNRNVENRNLKNGIDLNKSCNVESYLQQMESSEDLNTCDNEFNKRR